MILYSSLVPTLRVPTSEKHVSPRKRVGLGTRLTLLINYVMYMEEFAG